ncbi:MAG: ATP-binding protein [Planctomycetota bacterium]|nr:ATP-binding protein [Planctomycetota bacterium]
MDKPPHILVLDQDANTRRLLKAVLQDVDSAEIEAVASRSDAIAVLKRENPVDLVILDPASVTSRGWNLIADIRKAAPETPILVVSTVQTEQSLARAMEVGADDYLLKPADMAEFRKAVARLLQERRDLLGGGKAVKALASSLVVRSEGDGMLVEVVAPSGSMHLARFERFVNRLLALALTMEECLKLRLALEEVITNAKEWGNRGDAAKLVKVSYCLLSDRVTFRVEDQGEGFDPAKVPDPTLDPVSHVRDRRASGKRVGGWGILLARKSMDEVTYSRKGNVVFLTKYLRRPGDKVGAGAGQRAQPRADAGP